MPDTPERSLSPVSDMGDDEVSEVAEVGGSTTAEAPGPSEDTQAGSSRKGKGKGGQQNRSRVTVVCAECKRLKLKCDRKQPCTACKSKDKADKCIYSAEAHNKVDMHSVNIRVTNNEVALGLIARGIPFEYECSYPPAVEEIERRTAEYVAAGGILRPNPKLVFTYVGPNVSQSANDDPEVVPSDPSSLFSCLGDATHEYRHLICQAEGLQDQSPCECNRTFRASGSTDVTVKEEEGRVAMDVNMTKSVVPERTPRSAPRRKSMPALSVHTPDAMRHLPSPEKYYTAAPPSSTPAPSFYADSTDLKRAYIGSPGTSTPPETPTSAAQSPLGKRSSVPSTLPTSKPSVTQDLIKSLPPMPKCFELLARAQTVLTDNPVELGHRSRTAAYPQELKDVLANGELNKASGWVAFSKRVKRLWINDRQLRASTRQKPVPSVPSPSPIRSKVPAQNPKNAQAHALYSRGRDSDKYDAQTPAPTKPLDPRVVLEREKEKERSASATKPAAAPPINESLPFFAMACATFACGADPAKDSEPNDPESAPYLLALAQQALTIWVEGGEHLPSSKGLLITDEVVKEARADYFRTNSIAIQYYLTKASTSAQADRDGGKFMAFRHPHRRQLVNLMSKTAAQLAAWGYEGGLVLVEDKEETIPADTPLEVQLMGKIGVAEGEEARRRLYWQLLFYDTCIASMFDREPVIPRSKYSAATLPALIPDYREMIVNALQASDVVMESSGTAPQSGPPGDAPAVKDRREVEEERLRVERLFFGLRARLTQIASTVEWRRAKGYPPEGAEQLSNEVQTLLASAPIELRWAWQQAVEGTSFALLANGESVHTSDKGLVPSTRATSGKSKGKNRADDGPSNAKAARLTMGKEDEEMQATSSSEEFATSKLRTRSLSCELAILAQLLIVRIHYPFTVPNGAESSALSPVPVALLDASKAIIRIAKLFNPLGQPSSSLRSRPSTLLSMYPLDQLVFDATVFCAQHCFGGSIIKSKDDKAGVHKKVSGSEELIQTMNFGLELLESAYGISNGAGQASTSSDTTASPTAPLSVKTKMVASLRKQWQMRSSSFTSPPLRKRTRSAMEGKSAASAVEPAKDTASATLEGTEPGGPTEQGDIPPSIVSDQPTAQPPPSTQPSALEPTTAPSDANTASSTMTTPRFAVVQGAVAVAEKKKGRAASSGSRVTIRSRTAKDGSAVHASRRKHDSKSQTPTQPLLTTAARVLKKDGRLGYENEDQAPHAAQRAPSALQTVITPQPVQSQPSVEPSPQQQSYGGYDAAASIQQQPYPLASNDSSPAGQYNNGYDGTTMTESSMPGTPFQDYNYTNYAPVGAQNVAYDQQHQPAYVPHPQAPPVAPISMSPEGYYGASAQPFDASGFINAPVYGAPTGPDGYMKQQVATSSYSALSYSNDLPTTSGGAPGHSWQPPPPAPMQMQMQMQTHIQQPPQHSFPAWQDHHPSGPWTQT